MLFYVLSSPIYKFFHFFHKWQDSDTECIAYICRKTSLLSLCFFPILYRENAEIPLWDFALFSTSFDFLYLYITLSYIRLTLLYKTTLCFFPFLYDET